MTDKPISDQAALLHRLNDATKPVDAADRNLIIRALTAPTTGSAPVAMDAMTFGCYLIDHCEGEYVSEESVQIWLSSAAKDPQYAAPASSAASMLSEDARECLMDVVSHYDNIRAGFRAQEMEAFNAQDSDSMAYWVREIKVLERMKEQAQRALLAASMGVNKS
jgi:hypothetical protein